MNFPVRLKSVLAEGLTGDTGHFIWQGDQLLDRAMTIRFDKQLVRRLVFECLVENYTLKSHVLNAKTSSFSGNVKLYLLDFRSGITTS